MRKIILITGILLSVFTSYAQKTKFGIMFSPGISTSRVEGSFDKEDEITFDKSSAGLRFSVGPVLDVYLQDHIAVNFGILYRVKKASFKFETEISENDKSSKIEPNLNLQYISLPIGIKFITNDIASQARLYFQIGGNLDIKIHEKVKNKQEIDDLTGGFKEDFSKLLDAGINLGTGVEIDLGTSNSVFLGLNYNRGLVNVMSGDFGKNLEEDITNGVNVNKDNITFNNDLFSLVAGFRF